MIVLISQLNLKGKQFLLTYWFRCLLVLISLSVGPSIGEITFISSQLSELVRRVFANVKATTTMLMEAIFLMTSGKAKQIIDVIVKTHGKRLN